MPPPLQAAYSGTPTLSLSLSPLLLPDAHDPLFGHVDKLGEEIHPPAPVVEN